MSHQNDVNATSDSGPADLSPTTSFVYPVRSLLTGIHRPALGRSVTDNSLARGTITRLQAEHAELASRGGQTAHDEILRDSRDSAGALPFTARVLVLVS